MVWERVEELGGEAAQGRAFRKAHFGDDRSLQEAGQGRQSKCTEKAGSTCSNEATPHCVRQEASAGFGDTGGATDHL